MVDLDVVGLFNNFTCLKRQFSHEGQACVVREFINIHERNTKYTRTQNNNLWITPSVIPYGDWTHNSQRSRERTSKHFNHCANHVVRIILMIARHYKRFRDFRIQLLQAVMRISSLHLDSRHYLQLHGLNGHYNWFIGRNRQIWTQKPKKFVPFVYEQAARFLD